MTTTDLNSPPPKAMLWTGRVISALPIVFMCFGGVFFLFFKFDVVSQGMQKYEFPPSAGRAILVTEIACSAVYLIPQTATLGAILLTGYLGGAVATHVRAGENFTFPVVMGGLIWLGLLLRDRRLQLLLPWRKIGRSATSSTAVGIEHVDPIE